MPGGSDVIRANGLFPNVLQSTTVYRPQKRTDNSNDSGGVAVFRPPPQRVPTPPPSLQETSSLPGKRSEGFKWRQSGGRNQHLQQFLQQQQISVQSNGTSSRYGEQLLSEWEDPESDDRGSTKSLLVTLVATDRIGSLSLAAAAGSSTGASKNGSTRFVEEIAALRRLSTAPSSHTEEVLTEKLAFVPAVGVGGMSAVQEERNAGNEEQEEEEQERETGMDSPLEQSPAWRHLLATERYERDIIVHHQLSTSPLRFFDNLPGGSLGMEMRKNASVAFTPNEKLVGSLQTTLTSLFHSNADEIRAQEEARIAGFLMEEALASRTTEIVAPNDAIVQQLRMIQRAMNAKLELWQSAMQLYNTLTAELLIVEHEKEARLKLLGEFCSCKHPAPCPCLLLDWEIAELSGIELERSIRAPCIFVSAVLSFRSAQEMALLAERELQLRHFAAVQKLEADALRLKQREVVEERQAFVLLIGYHITCVRFSGEEVIVVPDGAMVSTELDFDDGSADADGSSRAYVVHCTEIANSNGALLLSKKQSFSAQFLTLQSGSPFLAFQTYLWLLEVQCEEVTRRNITTEILHQDFIAQTFSQQEREQRQLIAAQEATARLQVLERAEAHQRGTIDFVGRLLFRLQVVPRFLKRLKQMNDAILREEQRRIQYHEATCGLKALVEYQQNRRWSIELTQLQIFSSSVRTLFAVCRVSTAGKMRVLMLIREQQYLFEQETSSRSYVMSTYALESARLMTRKVLTVDELIADHFSITHDESSEWAIINEVLAPEVQQRHLIEGEWMKKWGLLFGVQFCRPSTQFSAAVTADLYSYGITRIVQMEVGESGESTRHDKRKIAAPPPFLKHVADAAKASASSAVVELAHPFAQCSVDLHTMLISDFSNFVDQDKLCEILQFPVPR